MGPLYKIQFIQGKTDAADYGQVKHTLADSPTARAVLTAALSPDKLQSVSNFTREPRRFTFECFTDSWLESYLLSGSYEHERYISHYEIRIARDAVVIFTGIIDTSAITSDVATGIVKITAFDRLKLFSIFSDLAHNYELLAGYSPIWILQYFIQDIRARVPLSIPYASTLAAPDISVAAGAPREIANVDYSALVRLPLAADGWTYQLHDHPWGPKYGFAYLPFSQIVAFVFANQVVIQATHDDPAATFYKARFQGRIFTFFNRLCPAIAEFDRDTGWVESDDFATERADFLAWFPANGISAASLDSLPTAYNLGSSYYTSSHWLDHYAAAHFHGAVLPVKLHPGHYYEKSVSAPLDSLKALQALLMSHNATLVSTPAGTITLKNKSAWASPAVVIDDADVVSLSFTRANLERPDTSVLSALAGDTTLLQSLVSEYLLDFHASLVCIDVVIDQLSKYTLSLQSQITIQSITYGISELSADPLNDEYRIKAWQL